MVLGKGGGFDVYYPPAEAFLYKDNLTSKSY